MINNFASAFLASTQGVVDPNGNMTNGLWQLLQSLYNRTGMGTGIYSVNNSIQLTAQNIGQANALLLTKDWNVVKSSVANGALILPPSMKPGNDCVIFNQDVNANPLLVFPPVGWKIDALAVNTAYSILNLKNQVFRVTDLTQIMSDQPG